ncbi:MAG: hypothetical protein ABH814_02735 [bacterium]
MALLKVKVMVFAANTLEQYNPAVRLEHPVGVKIREDLLEFEEEAEKEDFLNHYRDLLAPEAFSYPMDSWATLALMFDECTSFADMSAKSMRGMILIIHSRMLKPKLREKLLPLIRKNLEGKPKERKKHLVRVVQQ